MNKPSNFVRRHLPFIQGVISGFAAACLLTFICNQEDEPVQISNLASTSSKRDHGRKIIGYLKRDLTGVRIYESFHRAWSEGGPIVIDHVDDQSESMAYVTVSGVGDYVFSRNATPVHGVFRGDLERDNTAPNCYGILNINSVEFLPNDPSLYKGYIPK